MSQKVIKRKKLRHTLEILRLYIKFTGCKFVLGLTNISVCRYYWLILAD